MEVSREAVIAPIGTTLMTRSQNSVILTCPVLYYGKVEIAWYKDGKVIRDNRQFNDMLRMEKLSAIDSGEYDCVSDDVAKVKFGTVSLKVLGMCKK